MTKTEEKVRQYCLSKGLLDIGDTIAVGLSGGADSVCLLFMLLALKEEFDLKIHAIHVNHGIRGTEAARDQEFCRELCERLDVPFEVVCADVPDIAERMGESIEEAGRNVRYEEFNIYADIVGAQKIAVAHHRDDVSETFLFQLFRGSRLAGLSGIRSKNGRIIRPLLCLTRKEIEQYLSEKQQGYVVDSTNNLLEYSRNVIRLKILDNAETINSGASGHIADTAEYLSRVCDFVDKHIDSTYSMCVRDFMDEAPSHIDVYITELNNYETFLAEAVIYRVICRVAGKRKDITSDAVELCMGLLKKQSGRSLDLKYGVLVKRVYDKLVFTKNSVRSLGNKAPDKIDNLNGKCNNLVVEEYDIPEGLNGLEYATGKWGLKKDLRSRIFDKESFVARFGSQYVIQLRDVASDDFIAVYQDGRRRRVNDVLSDMKIPEDERAAVKVVAVGSEVLIVPDHRTTECCRVTDETTQVIIITLSN